MDTTQHETPDTTYTRYKRYKREQNIWKALWARLFGIKGHDIKNKVYISYYAFAGIKYFTTLKKL